MLSSDDILKKVAEDAIQVYGHVDVLVNNAGVSTIGLGPLEEQRYDIRGSHRTQGLTKLIASTTSVKSFK